MIHAALQIRIRRREAVGCTGGQGIARLQDLSLVAPLAQLSQQDSVIVISHTPAVDDLACQVPQSCPWHLLLRKFHACMLVSTQGRLFSRAGVGTEAGVLTAKWPNHSPELANLPTLSLSWGHIPTTV